MISSKPNNRNNFFIFIIISLAALPYSSISILTETTDFFQAFDCSKCLLAFQFCPAELLQLKSATQWTMPKERDAGNIK